MTGPAAVQAQCRCRADSTRCAGDDRDAACAVLVAGLGVGGPAVVAFIVVSKGVRFGDGLAVLRDARPAR